MRLRTVSAGLAVAAVAVMAAGGPVNAADDPSEDEVRTAVQRAVSGEATAADLEIIKNDPELARTVPMSVKAGDPVVTKADPPRRPAGRDSSASRAALLLYDQVCVNVDVPLTLTSWAGTTIYTWHHAFSYCTANRTPGREASRVISVGLYNRGDYLTDKSSVVYPQGLVTDVFNAPVNGVIGTDTTGVGSRFFSHMARSVNLCFAQFACYASNLPQSKLTIGRDGVAVAFASAL
ncbi:hypothetical protein ACIBCT_08835 [Streptosporangium sp. NPDC050855]|uniref:hypothetical protein n=1 Tax=Streptosporangium sp. NPDC050855 TaxID=3366194 RepID=UPI0037904B76